MDAAHDYSAGAHGSVAGSGAEFCNCSIHLHDVLKVNYEKFEISFQSRLGREKWLTPYTAERLATLPKGGAEKLLVVCPAFVSDCLETLEEIAEQGREIFLHAGGRHFTVIPCLNTHPLWVQAIVKWIREVEN